MAYEEKQALIKIVNSNNTIEAYVTPAPTVAAKGTTPLTIVPSSLKVEIYEVVPDMKNSLISFKYSATAFYTDISKPVSIKYRADYDGAISGVKLDGLCQSYGAIPTVTTDDTKNDAVIDVSGVAPVIRFTVHYKITYSKCDEQLVKVQVDTII